MYDIYIEIVVFLCNISQVLKFLVYMCVVSFICVTVILGVSLFSNSMAFN